MDNITHTLFCIALGRVGGKRLGPYATGLLVLAGNSPDIDAVSRFDSTASYLGCHRGITHSFVMAPVLAAAVVGIFVLGRRLARSGMRNAECGMRNEETRTLRTPHSTLRTPQFRLGRAYLVALAGVLVGHLFLDWSTSYGTRLLAPFSNGWLAWDAIPIFDLWLLVVLAAALTLPGLFRMISEEIGARGGSGRGAAVFAVAFLLAWFGFRGLCHTRAVAILDARLYRGLEPQRVAAFADVVNPFRWHGVVQTSESWEVAEINLLGEFDPTQARTYYPPEPSPALEAARQTRVGRIFLDFARFPYSYTEQTEDGFAVIMRDLRFEHGPASPKGFAAQFRLSPSLAVISQEFHFRPSGPIR